MLKSLCSLVVFACGLSSVALAQNDFQYVQCVPSARSTASLGMKLYLRGVDYTRQKARVRIVHHVRWGETEKGPNQRTDTYYASVDLAEWNAYLDGKQTLVAHASLKDPEEIFSYGGSTISDAILIANMDKTQFTVPSKYWEEEPNQQPTLTEYSFQICQPLYK